MTLQDPSAWQVVLRTWAPWAQPLPQAIQAALQAADPEHAVRSHLHRKDQTLWVDGHSYALAPARVRVLALGKAAYPMARAAHQVLGPLLHQGLIVTKDGYTGPDLPGFRQHAAGHPVPDTRSLESARLVQALLRDPTPEDLLLVLLSGGGSALLVDPAPGLTLEDVQTLNRLLLRAGATIHEINAVRKHVERLKGGGLARLAAPARVHTLVLSDVPGDDLSVIASGPTAPDPSTYRDAWEVLARYGLLEQAPPAVVAHLKAGLEGRLPETPKPGEALWQRVAHTLVGSVRLAAEAAWRAMATAGWRGGILTTTLQGEAREVARVLAAILQEAARWHRPFAPPACMVLGGETTVTVRGPGKGGRNQELALAAVPYLAGLEGAALVTLATDGTDGPTDAAGAVATDQTLARARARGLDPRRYLDRNDSYAFWEQMGGLLKTGPTRTNVNDLVFLCVK